jgi:hypothetical protein
MAGANCPGHLCLSNTFTNRDFVRWDTLSIAGAVEFALSSFHQMPSFKPDGRFEKY